jgi:hypothetical protein
MPHIKELRAGLDAVRLQDGIASGAAKFQTRQSRADALQALRVAPLQDSREALPALPPSQVLVFDQAHMPAPRCGSTRLAKRSTSELWLPTRRSIITNADNYRRASGDRSFGMLMCVCKSRPGNAGWTRTYQTSCKPLRRKPAAFAFLQDRPCRRSLILQGRENAVQVP